MQVFIRGFLKILMNLNDAGNQQKNINSIASAVLTRQRFVWKSVQPHLLPHFLELGELAPAFNRSHRIKTLSVSVFRLTIFFGEKMQSAFVTIFTVRHGLAITWREIKFHSESSICLNGYI